MNEYIDARQLHDDYKPAVCPESGEYNWFKFASDGWRCQNCGSRETHDIEYTCQDCNTRMVGDGGKWECRICGIAEPRDTDELVDRLTGEFDAPGYARSDWQTCPVCTEESILCGPDGELVCGECDEFYAGQFTDEWYAYAEWLHDPMRVRVRKEADDD